MNPIIWAAIISGGWAAVVAAIGYRFNRATAKATVQATNANAQAALDAAHAGQLWEKRAEAYADIIALVSRRQAARSDLMRMLRYDEDTEERLRQATEPPPGMDWAKIRARLTAFAARPVVDAMNATMDADNEVRATMAGNLVADPELRYTSVSRGFGITEEPFAANPRVAVPCGRV